MHTRDIISEEFPVVKSTSPGIEVLNLMEEFRVDHLPIVNEEEFLGLISSEELYNMEDLEAPVGSLSLSMPHMYIYGHQPIYDAIRMMHVHHLSVLPVINEAGHYEGTVLLSGLLTHFASLTAATEPGAIIVLEVNTNDYALSEIARIVESDDAKVLSLYIRTLPDSTRMEITLKVNKMKIPGMLQTFHRYNYLVTASFSEGETADDLRDRYNLLMYYLNT